MKADYYELDLKISDVKTRGGMIAALEKVLADVKDGIDFSCLYLDEQSCSGYFEVQLPGADHGSRAELEDLWSQVFLASLQGIYYKQGLSNNTCISQAEFSALQAVKNYKSLMSNRDKAIFEVLTSGR